MCPLTKSLKKTMKLSEKRYGCGSGRPLLVQVQTVRIKTERVTTEYTGGIYAEFRTSSFISLNTFYGEYKDMVDLCVYLSTFQDVMKLQI